MTKLKSLKGCVPLGRMTQVSVENLHLCYFVFSSVCLSEEKNLKLSFSTNQIFFLSSVTNNSQQTLRKREREREEKL